MKIQKRNRNKICYLDQVFRIIQHSIELDLQYNRGVIIVLTLYLESELNNDWRNNNNPDWAMW